MRKHNGEQVVIRDLRPRPGYAWFYYQVFDNFAGKVGFQAWGVYCALLRYVNADCGQARVSLDRLALVWGVHVATIKRATAILERSGLILKRKRQGVSEYYILDPRVCGGNPQQ